MTLEKLPKFYRSIDRISAAVLKAHSMGSFGDYGRVEVDRRTGEIFTSQYASSRNFMRGCQTIYDNQKRYWSEGMNLNCIIIDNTFIIAARDLHNKKSGREATEKEKKIAGLVGDVRALSEYDMYNNINWRNILADAINTAAEMYADITHYRYARRKD